MAAVATLPGLGVSTFPLFVPTATGAHDVVWDGTGTVTFSAPWTSTGASSASVQATTGQLVTMSILQSQTEQIRNVRVSYSASALQPSRMADIGGAAFTLIKDWDFGTSGNIGNTTQLDAEFNYAGQWNTFNNGGQYGTDVMATSALTAISGQPVDPGGRYREFTTSSILCHVKSKVNDSTNVGPASARNGGNGGFFSKLLYPHAGSGLGKTIVWETRFRIVNPTFGQWFALWTAGLVWDGGPEMDVIEAFSLFDANEAWHSNIVGTGTENIDYWSGNWWDGQIAAGIVAPNNQLDQWRVLTWVYHSNNAFEVYFDTHVAQSGTLEWDPPSGGSAGVNQNLQFFFDMGALHTGVSGYDTYVIPAADLPITYEIDYSRVWERMGV